MKQIRAFERQKLDFLKSCNQKVHPDCELLFMEGYRLELHGPVLDYAMKKYRGHRTIPGDQVQLIREEFTVHQAIKRENQLKRNNCVLHTK
jgi:hypothetical protein